jgi:hypothetical protein
MVALKNFFTRILLNLLEAFIVEVFSKLIEMIKDKIKDYYRNKMENENDDQKRKDIEKTMKDVCEIFDDINNKIPDILKSVTEEHLQQLDNKVKFKKLESSKKKE